MCGGSPHGHRAGRRRHSPRDTVERGRRRTTAGISAAPLRRGECVTQARGNKILKYNSIFLGVFMFLFGFLKFFEPFRTWFDVQITKSGLPRSSIALGKAGEMAIGLGLLSSLRARQKVPI